MDKQINQLMGDARAVLSRTDVVDHLIALDNVLYNACPSGPSLVVTLTMNHIAFVASLANTPAELDRILTLVAKVQHEIVTTKRERLGVAVPATATVH